MKLFFKSIYFSNRIYGIMAAEIILLVMGFFFPFLYLIAKFILLIIIGLLLADILILYRNKNGFSANRNTLDKLSNGDINEIKLYLENRYLFKATIRVIDELPV